MEFKHWLISEEIYQNKTAVVYHRTQTPTSIKGIIQSGFRPGEGCFYGCGLYTTYELKDQFKENMEYLYGSYIMAYKATSLDKYLVFQIDEAKKIHGADWRLSSQIPKLSKSLDNEIKLSKDITLDQIDEMQQKGGYSSEISRWLHNEFMLDQQGLKGIIYEGQRDGKCLLKYEPINEGVDLVLLRYAYAPTSEGIENIKWIGGTSLASARTHSLYRKQIAGKEFETGFDELPLTKSKLINILSNSSFVRNDLEGFGKKELTSLANELTDEEILSIIENAFDRNSVADFILRHIKRELSQEIVYYLLRWTSDVSLASKNIKNLRSAIDAFSNDAIKSLLIFGKSGIINLILDNKEELDSDLFYYVLRNLNDLTGVSDKIKNLDYRINDMEESDIDELLAVAADKKGLLDLIINHRKELSSKILLGALVNSRNISATAKKIGEKNLQKIALWRAKYLNFLLKKINWPNKEIEDLLRKYATEDQKAYLREQGIDV